jgi:hypothetical protein
MWPSYSRNYVLSFSKRYVPQSITLANATFIYVSGDDSWLTTRKLIMGAAASVPSDRGRSLKIIGAGYSRTGTLSLALALEVLLGGPVMHGGSQLLGREDGVYIMYMTLQRRRSRY